MKAKTILGLFAKGLIHFSPLRPYFFPRYPFNLTARQLCYVCECLERTRYVPGAVVEVGCASGWTTIFLNKYMDAQGLEKEYVCIDTFRGFAPEDIRYEVSRRGKRSLVYSVPFAVNKKGWFDRTMAENGVVRVRSIQADVNGFEFCAIGPLSLCLLDVDLYRPTKAALPRLLEILSPGGMILVDDCNPDCERYEGAAQAYREFVRERALPERILFGKFGVLERTIS
jgi:O-methyltransferase